MPIFVDPETNESYNDSQIAVDHPHVGLVLEHLNKKGDPPSATLIDEEPRLSLGLIELADVEATKRWFVDTFGEANLSDPVPVSTLDWVLNGLRHSIKQEHGPWLPDIGKERDAKSVGGLPHIGTGGSGYPSVAAEIGSYGAGTEGQYVRVGVIDTEMAPNSLLDDHWYTLESSSLLTADDTGEDGYPWLQGHMAFVAGRILRCAPSAMLEIRGVLHGDEPKATVWEVAKAMADFLSSGVSLINLSIGCETADNDPPFVLKRAVDVLTQNGILIIAAAGNNGRDNDPDNARHNAPIFPAACPGAIAVGAVDEHAGYAAPSFSPVGPWISLVGPGVDVVSTYLTGKVRYYRVPGLGTPPYPVEFEGFASWSGTSFAAATVTGEIASRMVPGRNTARGVLAELLGQDPAQHQGIGRYEAPKK